MRGGPADQCAYSSILLIRIVVASRCHRLAATPTYVNHRPRGIVVVAISRCGSDETVGGHCTDKQAAPVAFLLIQMSADHVLRKTRNDRTFRLRKRSHTIFTKRGEHVDRSSGSTREKKPSITNAGRIRCEIGRKRFSSVLLLWTSETCTERSSWRTRFSATFDIKRSNGTFWLGKKI